MEEALPLKKAAKSLEEKNQFGKMLHFGTENSRLKKGPRLLSNTHKHRLLQFLSIYIVPMASC